MTYLERYIPLGANGEELEINVRYSLGGTSWFHGGVIKRGLKVDFTPVRRAAQNGWASKTTTLGDDRGRSFHIETLGRKSDKKGAALAAFVDAHIEALGAAASVQDWSGVNNILAGYTDPLAGAHSHS